MLSVVRACGRRIPAVVRPVCTLVAMFLPDPYAFSAEEMPRKDSSDQVDDEDEAELKVKEVNVGFCHFSRFF